MALRTELYNLFKSYGFVMSLYDVDGNGPTMNIEEAEYIYCKKGNETFMVVIEDNTTRDYDQVFVYKTTETSNIDFRTLLMQIKKIAIQNSFTVTVKNFGKRITPKDFSVLPVLSKNNKEEELEESYKIKGYKKTSHFVKENARVIVKHHSDINKKKNNANSRDIKEVWVATRSGERRKIAESHLTLGKVVANHVNHGGSLYDNTTNKLIALGEDLEYFKKMKPLREDLDPEKATSVRQLIKETRKVINRFLGNLALRKKKVNESDLPDYNTPEFSFTKAFYEDLADEEVSDRLSRMSIFSSFIK